MDDFLPLLNQNVEVEISGKVSRTGVLLDVGNDIIVLYDGENYLYIPYTHIQGLSLNLNKDEEVTYDDQEGVPFESVNTLSLRAILNNSKGMFSEIQILSHHSVHGYVTNILSDYLVFYSPVFKTMLIPIQHLKWLIPYPASKTPYSLTKDKLPVNPTSITLSRSFELQLEKLCGKIVVFDLGVDINKVGQLIDIKQNFAKIATAKDEALLINIQHVKSVHFE